MWTKKKKEGIFFHSKTNRAVIHIVVVVLFEETKQKISLFFLENELYCNYSFISNQIKQLKQQKKEKREREKTLSQIAT